MKPFPGITIIEYRIYVVYSVLKQPRLFVYVLEGTGAPSMTGSVHRTGVLDALLKGLQPLVKCLTGRKMGMTVGLFLPRPNFKPVE